MASKAYRRYALASLTCVFTLNMVDRGLMSLLLQPIKLDLQLSDTQLGLVTGIAFGAFYATLGLPIARWADRGNRVTITALAIGLWGLTVMACLFVTSYVQLACARIAAAVGESGCKPPTYSLVGDYFPEPAERAGAMAVYLTASPVAALVSYVIGGWLNELVGWRLTFFIMGIPGLVMAVVIKLTLRETRDPVRRTDASTAPSMATILGVLWRQRSLRHLCIALILLYTMGQGLGPWYAAFMMRSHAMQSAELGLWLGMIFGIGGIVGVLLGGYAAARIFAANEKKQMRMNSLAIAAFLPFFVAFLFLPGKHQALLALVPLMVVFNLFLGPIYVLLQRLTADDMRATMMALVMLISNLIGMGLGPLLVGLCSDALRPSYGAESLRYAMLSMSFISLWASYHFWVVGRTVGADLASVALGNSRG